MEEEDQNRGENSGLNQLAIQLQQFDDLQFDEEIQNPPQNNPLDANSIEEWIIELQQTPTHEIEPEMNNNWESEWESWNIDNLFAFKNDEQFPAAEHYLEFEKQKEPINNELLEKEAHCLEFEKQKEPINNELLEKEAHCLEFEKDLIRNELLEKERLPRAHYMIEKEIRGGFVLFDKSEVLKLITYLDQCFTIEDKDSTATFFVWMKPFNHDETTKYRIVGEWKRYVDSHNLKDGDMMEFSVTILGASTITARRM